MTKEQLELCKEIWERLSDAQKTDTYWKRPGTRWIPGIPNIPIFDEGWCENWLLDTGDIEICNLKSRHKIEVTYHYGKQPIREEADDLLTALLKLVLQVMKEE